MERVETIKLHVRPPSEAAQRLFEHCVDVTRAAWNWLVAMDRPVFKLRQRNYAQAMAQAKAEMPDEPDDSKRLKARAKAICRSMEKANPLPPLPSRSVFGKGGSPAKAFEESIPEDREDVRTALEAVVQGKCKSVLHEVFDRYEKARDAALGFASGKRRKGGPTGIPRFLAKSDTNIHASVAWQVQEGTAKRPTVKLGQFCLVTSQSGEKIYRRGAIRLKGHLGWVCFRDAGTRLTEALTADAKTDRVRLVREQGKWFVTFDVTYQVPEPEPKTKAIGIDRGVTVPIATSEGLLDPTLNGTAMLRRLRRLERRKAHLQRVASRRLRAAAEAVGALTETGGFKRGIRIPRSNRYLRAEAQVAAVSDKISRIRGEWHAQLACHLAERYGMVVVEDLPTQRMTRSAKGTIDAPGRNVAAKAGLNRSILNIGWSAFEARLSHALERRGGHLIKVEPAYTSQTCHACGVIDAASRKGQVFHCVHCGHEDHADVNAAKNILARGVGERSPEPAGDTQPMRVESHSASELEQDSGAQREESRSPGIASALLVCETPASAREAQAVDYPGFSSGNRKCDAVKEEQSKAIRAERSQTPLQLLLFPGLAPGAAARPG
jgi:transposase